MKITQTLTTIASICCLSIVISTKVSAAQCPTYPTDTVIPITDYDPPALPGEPEMTTEGVHQFVLENSITSVSEFMEVLPEHYQKNYVLVDETRTPGHSSLEYPRIILFGSDARMMVNVSTDPADPDYEKVDLAYMNDENGAWEFTQLDFGTGSGVLDREPESCSSCHGTPSRPFWGEYLVWPGIFGDDPAPGAQAETLTQPHAQRFNELKSGQGNSERFNTLIWSDSYRTDGSQQLPDHAYGFAMSIFNMELGFVVAESIYLRMKTQFPERFETLKEELLLLSYYGRKTRSLTQEDRYRISLLITEYGGTGSDIHDLYNVLGINLNNELSLHKLADEEPDIRWNVGSEDLIGLVDALILKDLVDSDPEVKKILQEGPNNYGIFTCPELGDNTLDVLEYKITHGWSIKGAARQEVQETFFGLDVDRIYSPIFQQVAGPLYEHLSSKISDSEVTPPDNSNPAIEDACETKPSVEGGRLSDGEVVCVADADRSRYFAIWVPSNTGKLVVRSGHGSGQNNLYYGANTWASESAYTLASEAPGTVEEIIVNNPRRGWKYITVRGSAPYRNVALEAKFE